MQRLAQYRPEVTSAWGRIRIVMGGKDVTWHADADGAKHPTLVSALNFADPLPFQGASIRFPGLDGQVTYPRSSAYRWMDTEKLVVIQRIAPGGIKEDLYRGRVARVRPMSGGVGIEVGVDGELQYMAGQNQPPQWGPLEEVPLEQYIKKVWDNHANRQVGKLLIEDTTGIPYAARGSWETALDLIASALERAVTPEGETYTIAWSDTKKRYVFRKRRQQHVWTVHAFQPGVEADLERQWDSRLDAVFASGVDSQNRFWSNTFYPNAKRGAAPKWPVDMAKIYAPGDRLPASVGKPLWAKMRSLGFKIQSTNTTYDARDRQDIIDLQERAGIEAGPSGTFGAQTWAAVFSPGKASSVGEVHRSPMVQKTQYRRVNRNADGQIIGKNPGWIDRPGRTKYIDFGEGVSKKQGRAACQAILSREAESVVGGTITFTGDPQEGSRFDIRPGHTLRVLGWLGEPWDLHVSETSLDLEAMSVTATVTSRPGPAWTVADELGARAETRALVRTSNNDPTPSDRGPVWDMESPAGIVQPTSHHPGLGSVTYIPVPHVFDVATVELHHDTPTEFVVALFNRPVTVAQVEGLLGGNPLKLSGDPWADKEDALSAAGLIWGAGSKDNPVGYGRSMKSATAKLTGSHYDDAAFGGRVHGKTGHLCLVTWTVRGAHTTGRFYPAKPGD